MDLQALSKEETEFALAVQKQVRQLLCPVPFFIWSPGELNHLNQEKVKEAITTMLSNPSFIQGICVDGGIDPLKVAPIMLGASGFELWKRNMMMKAQWVLQFVAMGLFWTIVL